MAEKSLSSNFKLQVTNLGFDRRFVQVCRLWKYIFNRTDTLLLSLFSTSMLFIYLCTTFIKHIIHNLKCSDELCMRNNVQCSLYNYYNIIIIIIIIIIIL